MKTSRALLKIAIVVISILISGLLYFIAPWDAPDAPAVQVSRGDVGVPTQQQRAEQPIPEIAKAPKSGSFVSVMKTLNGAERVFPASTTDLSETLQRAIGDVKKEIEAIEIANAEIYPIAPPEEEGAIMVVVKLKAPDTKSLERVADAVESARKLLASDQDEGPVFRGHIQAMMNQFTDFGKPFKALRFYRVPEKGVTSFAVMDTHKEGNGFMNEKGHLILFSGGIASDKADWSSGKSWTQKRYGHLFDISDGGIRANPNIKQAQQ